LRLTNAQRDIGGKIGIALTPEMAGAVRAAVESGEYAAASDEIREALRVWKSHQAAREREAEALRLAWQDGIESGPATPLDFADLKAKARTGLTKERGRTR
jgi:antitoxin ParD1/3/4